MGGITTASTFVARKVYGYDNRSFVERQDVTIPADDRKEIAGLLQRSHPSDEREPPPIVGDFYEIGLGGSVNLCYCLQNVVHVLACPK